MQLLFAPARPLRQWWASRHFPLCPRTETGRQLCRLEDVPPEQYTSPHILTGYRRCRSRYECLLSLLQWHNETVNIWSNQLPLAYLIVLLVQDNAGGRFTGAVLWQRALVTVMTLSYAATLFLSAAYHTLNCMSESRAWYRLDFAGVWLSIVAYVVGFTALQFRGSWRLAHVVGALIAAGPSFVLAASSRYVDRHYDAARVRAMGWFSLYSMLPLAHYALFYGDPVLVARTLPGHVTVLLLLALSLCVFVTRFPERRWPGRVDYLGSSHQIWHVGVGICVLLAHRIQLAYVTPL